AAADRRTGRAGDGPDRRVRDRRRGRAHRPGVARGGRPGGRDRGLRGPPHRQERRRAGPGPAGGAPGRAGVLPAGPRADGADLPQGAAGHGRRRRRRARLPGEAPAALAGSLAVRTLIYNTRMVVPMDDGRSRIPNGYVLVKDHQIERVGAGPAPTDVKIEHFVDARGKIALPGLVNTHHHLPQTLTRNIPRVQEAPLFRWLTELYEVWRGVDAAAVEVAARVGLGELLLTGCTTTTDHLYLFPRGQDRLIDVEVAAARELGIRFHPTRGSMSRGRSQGGLPPDDVVQGEDTILEDCRRLIREYHDPRPGAMTRIALAPCSPFSVTTDLMRRTRDLARAEGVRLHTHLAETKDEETFCLEMHGVRPVEYVRRLGWLGPDVWMAHSVHRSAEEVALFGETR